MVALLAARQLPVIGRLPRPIHQQNLRLIKKKPPMQIARPPVALAVPPSCPQAAAEQKESAMARRVVKAVERLWAERPTRWKGPAAGLVAPEMGMALVKERGRA